MELNDLRREIDAIDGEIISLLERRMDVASSIADAKARTGKPILDAAREAEKLAAVKASCRPETAEGIAGIFESVMSASRAHQARRMESSHGK